MDSIDASHFSWVSIMFPFLCSYMQSCLPFCALICNHVSLFVLLYAIMFPLLCFYMQSCFPSCALICNHVSLLVLLYAIMFPFLCSYMQSCLSSCALICNHVLLVLLYPRSENQSCTYTFLCIFSTPRICWPLK